MINSKMILGKILSGNRMRIPTAGLRPARDVFGRNKKLGYQVSYSEDDIHENKYFENESDAIRWMKSYTQKHPKLKKYNDYLYQDPYDEEQGDYISLEEMNT